jgi:DNA-binding XRE family transcriptional regulator
MIRAARGILNLEQSELATIIGVDRRTINRIENDGPTENPRRLEVCKKIRDTLENEFHVVFIYQDKSTGEGVVMKKGK